MDSVKEPDGLPEQQFSSKNGENSANSDISNEVEAVLEANLPDVSIITETIAEPALEASLPDVTPISEPDSASASTDEAAIPVPRPSLKPLASDSGNDIVSNNIASSNVGMADTEDMDDAMAVTELFNQSIPADVTALYEDGKVVEVVPSIVTEEAVAKKPVMETVSPAAVEKKKPSKPNQFQGIIGQSDTVQRVFNAVERLADTDSTVLILGESGTGKELFANAIHNLSPRKGKNFVVVNCGAIPEDLLESELFGHEKGSFTGAIRTRMGKFELANGGTIFLDEIGDMSPQLQVKLLRILQEKKFERIGGNQVIKTDARVLAATNRNLRKAIKENAFREDLYYRLNVIPLNLPPLRERKGDVPLLIEHFITSFNPSKNRAITGIMPEVLEALEKYDWPGNIRELENICERMVVLKGEGVLGMEDLPLHIMPDSVDDEQLMADMMLVGGHEEEVDEPQQLLDGIITDIPVEGLNLKAVMDEYETMLILKALDKTGNVKNQAAALLGLNRTTLVEKLKKKGINR